MSFIEQIQIDEDTDARFLYDNGEYELIDVIFDAETENEYIKNARDCNPYLIRDCYKALNEFIDLMNRP